MEKLKNISTLIIFAVILLGLCVAFFALPDIRLSYTERRLLAQSPDINTDTIFSGEYMKDFETYMQDQFPLRETFRTINAVTRRSWGQRDHNGYYFVGGHLSQLEFPLNADAVRANAAWLNAISYHFLQDMNIFYAVIPDKNYFLANGYGFLSMDYDEMLNIIHRQMRNHTYIDLFGVMSLDDFYRTDIHWRQEAIFPVAQRLAQSMGVQLPSPNDLTSRTLTPFYGSFHGHAALPVRPDDLIFLSNRYIDSAVVRTLTEENREFVFSQYINDVDGERVRLGVNNPRLFNNPDSYDVFLAGAQAIMTIEVPNASTDRELIIFRDSFGSSIAPLLLGGYSKITLVDIRYIPSRMLPNLIEFNNQDILFLYSTQILNRGGLFR